MTNNVKLCKFLEHNPACFFYGTENIPSFHFQHVVWPYAACVCDRQLSLAGPQKTLSENSFEHHYQISIEANGRTVRLTQGFSCVVPNQSFFPPQLTFLNVPIPVVPRRPIPSIPADVRVAMPN